MKILESNQEYFKTVGITRHQAMQWQPFNMKNLLEFLAFCLCAVPSVGFLAFEANTFDEYTESVYFLSANILVAIIFLMFILTMADFFAFIDGWEQCAMQSKYGNRKFRPETL